MPSVAIGRQVFTTEASALQRAGEKLDGSFEEAVKLIIDTRGRIIVSGMGKSGIVGQKIAATLASTGTPSFAVHPAEAYHGDLGMFTGEDVAILISSSGETEEVIRLIPSLKHFGVKIIALVGKKTSTLARNSDLVLDISVERECCPNNLAPTTSTTVTLAMGDALAVALIDRRQFMPMDFAVFHPGGSLGRRLLTHVSDVMHPNVPVTSPTDSMRDVIMSITEGGLGLTVVVEGNEIQGVITDGDLRRSLFEQDSIDGVLAGDIMSRSPLTIKESDMFSEAESLMHSSNVTALVVVNDVNILVGVLKLQDARRIK